jgi:hypothetical protein
LRSVTGCTTRDIYVYLKCIDEVCKPEGAFEGRNYFTFVGWTTLFKLMSCTFATVLRWVTKSTQI